jgi:methionyl-tRNA formyltransferase
VSHGELANGNGRVVFVGAALDAAATFDVLLRSRAEVAGLVTLDPEQGARTPGFVDLARTAEMRGVPVLRTRDINDTETVEWVSGHSPDLMVCAGWNRLLGPATLAIPQQGVVGFHASLLPRYRGRAPVCWAILRGETLTGNTMLMLAPGVNTGDIVDQQEIPIEPHDTCAGVYEKVAASGADMLRRHLGELLTGTAPRRPQVVHHFDRMLPPRTPEMGITSFGRTAVEVHNWIRALSRPYDGAFAYLRGEKLVLWRADVLAGAGTRMPPGLVLGVEGGGVVVTTRAGLIRLLEVQVPDRPAEPAARWFARSQVPPGSIFEPVDRDTIAWTLGRGHRDQATKGSGPGPGSAGKGSA